MKTIKTQAHAPQPETSSSSLQRARDIADRVPRRKNIPIRTSYIRSDSPAHTPPLAKLVSSGGRGGGTAIKLHLALLWLAAKPPFQIQNVRARAWADLLDLDDPTHNGKRRINAALAKLEEEKLVSLQRHRGDATTITLRHESGLDLSYPGVPSTTRVRAPDESKSLHNYFQVPRALWLKGHIQAMSPKALAMLLVILEEQYGDHEREVWWSEARFRDLFGLSRGTRTQGTQELAARKLARIERKPVYAGRSPFSDERMRNTYIPINEARLDL